MRTFTFSDTKSQKFWNIDLQGNQFTVAYGKIGTKGQTQTKTFADEAKAQKEHDKLILEKLAKGYVETTPKLKSSKEVLEEAIIQNPNDKAAFAAYADLLIEEGDPQGEFIQVQLALEDESLGSNQRKKLQQREQELLKLHERTWLGPLASIYLDHEGVDDWRKKRFERYYWYRFVRGVLAELYCNPFNVNYARMLLQSTKETRFVHTIRFAESFSETPDSDYEVGDDLPKKPGDYPAWLLLAKWKNLPHIHCFHIGELEDKERPNCYVAGDHAHSVVRQMPLIEELRLYAHRVDFAKLSILPMPYLRILDLAHTHQYPLKKLAENKSLTKLEQLLMHPHAVENAELPYQLPDLKAICRSPHLPNLTHFRMRLSMLGDKAIEEIINSGFIKRLKYLDLFAGTVTDKGAELLANCPDVKNLETLDLSANELTTEGIKKLRRLKIPNIHVRTQHESSIGVAPEDLWELEFLFCGDRE